MHTSLHWHRSNRHQPGEPTPRRLASTPLLLYGWMGGSIVQWMSLQCRLGSPCVWCVLVPFDHHAWPVPRREETRPLFRRKKAGPPPPLVPCRRVRTAAGNRIQLITDNTTDTTDQRCVVVGGLVSVQPDESPFGPWLLAFVWGFRGTSRSFLLLEHFVDGTSKPKSSARARVLVLGGGFACLLLCCV